jgi:tetratricopeptide (TPR) repeat protein
MLKLNRDYEGAMRCNDDCHTLAMELGELSVIAMNLVNRGHMLVDLDRFVEAKKCFRDAETRNRALSDLEDAGAALEGQAWLTAREGKLDEALKMYADAEKLAATSDLRINAGIKVSRGENLVDAGRAAEALEELRAALATFEARKMRDRDLFKCLTTLARCEQAIGLPQAQAHALQALELATQLGYAPTDPALRVRRNLEALHKICDSQKVSAQSP